MARLYKIITIVLCLIITSILMVFSSWAFVCDRFTVKGDSMYPTLSSGDIIWVNKLCMGARIYTGYNFESPKLEAFRMPGFSGLEVGDMAVFNVPFGRDRNKIEFKINYVYAKRCLGCPGDVIGINDSFFYNDRMPGQFGQIDNQKSLKHMPDSLIPNYVLAAYPYSSDYNWTIRNLGPLIVPAADMEIILDKPTVQLYAHVIEYETGYYPFWDEQGCHIGEGIYDKYRFCEDYYYFVGDNVLDSKDSRYFGFVPAEYIIGKVVCI